MDVERINPAELARPSGFSHAVAVTGGRMVFLAGQVGMARDGTEIGAVWHRLAGTEYPATAAVGVARLWDPEALVELQGIAAVNR